MLFRDFVQVAQPICLQFIHYYQPFNETFYETFLPVFAALPHSSSHQERQRGESFRNKFGRIGKKFAFYHGI